MKRKRIKGKDRGGNRYLYMNAGILNERQLIVSLQVKKTDTRQSEEVLHTRKNYSCPNNSVFKYKRKQDHL